MNLSKSGVHHTPAREWLTSFLYAYCFNPIQWLAIEKGRRIAQRPSLSKVDENGS
jgi:hypothetical protein